MGEVKTDVKCPECGEGNLVYDEGDWGSFYQPPEPDTVYCPECGWDGEPEKYLIMGYVQLCKEYCGVETNDFMEAKKIIERHVYRNTETGVIFTDFGIQGYVEGYDAELPIVRFEFPISLNQFSEMIRKEDERSEKVWNCINLHGDECNCYLSALEM